MGDTDAAAMARMTAEVEEEEVDVMELVRRLQEDRSEGMRDEPGTDLFRNYNYSKRCVRHWSCSHCRQSS